MARPTPKQFAVVACVTAIAVALGCNVEKHYEVLSFFFDGVPNPEEVAAAKAARAMRRSGSDAGIIASAHSAFEERRCEACHGEKMEFGFRVSGFTDLDASVCLECHSEELVRYRVLHGPVAAVACLVCHEAHESRHPSLLVASGEEVCMHCHAFHLQLDDPPPHHTDVSANCLDCHSGHGSSKRGLLKPEQEIQEIPEKPAGS